MHTHTHTKQKNKTPTTAKLLFLGGLRSCFLEIVSFKPFKSFFFFFYVKNLNLICTGTIHPDWGGSACGSQPFLMKAMERSVNQQVRRQMSPEDPGAGSDSISEIEQRSLSFPGPFFSGMQIPGEAWELHWGLFSHLRYRTPWALFWISHRYISFTWVPIKDLF